MYEHNALGYMLGLAFCLTKVRSSRARCPATALIADAFCLLFFCCTYLYMWLILLELWLSVPIMG